MPSSSRPPLLQFHRTAARKHISDSLTYDGLAADIFHNPNDARGWTFIVTREGSSEVLYWGRERALDLARRAALAMLQVLAAGERAAAG